MFTALDAKDSNKSKHNLNLSPACEISPLLPLLLLQTLSLKYHHSLILRLCVHHTCSHNACLCGLSVTPLNHPSLTWTRLTSHSFLPHTVDFHDLPTPARRPSPPPRIESHSRKTSLTGTVSLFPQPTPPRTPAAIDDSGEFFSQIQSSAATHFLKAGDTRTLVRSDAHLPEWGRGMFFNQPHSRAEKLPSSLVLGYGQSPPPSEDRLPRKTYKKFSKTPNSRDKSRNRSKSTEKHSWGQSWTIETAEQGNGGLANAVAAAQREGTVEHIIWLGTVGFPTDSLPESTRDDISSKLESEYDEVPVFVTDSDLDGHYSHYCKTILWPVFHYQIPDHPKSKAYEDHSWKFYVNLNQAFADKVVQGYKRGDIIWIHDYHLLLVPKMVRDKLPDAQIGFFLHTAFPSSEVFRCLSVRKQLLEGMLGANLVAFQSLEYQEHFLTTCSRLLTVEATAQGVQLEDRFVHTTSRPIGIDPVGLNQAREEPEVEDWIKVMKERYKDKHLIVARDKLDNIRGVRQKLLGYELFLNKYPEWREKVVLIQVATSSPDNSDLSMQVSDIVTRIDSQYSTLAHQPLILLRQDISFSQYIALLSVADLLMITSLREGMNLTCHEFIVCQDGRLGNKKQGPVILSEFTGSSAIFKGADLCVNPWDYQQMATKIKEALEMKDEERESRYNKMNAIVHHNTGDFWVNALTEDLNKAFDEDCKRDTMAIPRLSVSSLGEKYSKSDARVFILDYEGTLASFSTPNNLHFNSPDRVISTINELLNDSRNIVYLMSGRMPEQVARLFDRVPGLGLIAESGCFLRYPGNERWDTFANLDQIAAWKASVKTILQYYQDRVEGSTIEERHSRLILHYGKAEDKELADRLIPECANHINEACEMQKVRAVPHTADRMLVVEPLEWAKAATATRIFEQIVAQAKEQGAKAPDFLFVAGDDREDEAVFQWANELGEEKVKNVTTVSVGKRNTQAMATLTQGTSGMSFSTLYLFGILANIFLGLLSVLQKLAKLR